MNPRILKKILSELFDMDGASSAVNVDPPSITTSSLKKLPEAIDEALLVDEK